MLSSNKLRVLIWGSLLLFSCGGAQKDPNKIYFDNPADYNAYISTQYDEVNRLWENSLSKMDDGSVIYIHLDSLEKTSSTSAENMRKLSDFKGDTMFKHRAEMFFSYMSDIVKNDFRQAVDIGLMNNVPDSLLFKFDVIGHQIGADKDTCINRLLIAQQNFIRLTQK